MKLNEEDKVILEALIIIGKKIYDEYVHIANRENIQKSIEVLAELLKKEKALYRSLNLNSKKAKSIRYYYEYIEGIEVNNHMPSVLSDSFSKDTYPIHRIISRCRYLTLNEISTLEVSIGNVRKELIDFETMLTYMTTLKDAEKYDNKLSNKLRLWALLNLIDSKNSEDKLIETKFDCPQEISNMVYFAISLIIERQRHFMGMVKNVNLIVLDEDYDGTYSALTASRINEIFNGLLYTVYVFTKFCNGTSDDDLYLFMINYMKALVSMASKETRIELYKTLLSKAEKEPEKDRKYILELLKKAIEEIEADIIPSIINISAHKRLTT